MIHGIICQKCSGWFTKFPNVKRRTEYEGIEVNVFDCPCCGEEIDDLGCDFFEGVQIGGKCPCCGSKLPKSDIGDKIQCSECICKCLIVE